MDYEHNDTPQSEDWIDDVLGESPLQSEIGPDEHAVHSAGLIHPDDIELEMILAEHREEETDPDEPFDFDVPVFDEAVYSSEEQEALCEELSSDETQIFLPEEESEEQIEEPEAEAEETEEKTDEEEKSEEK